LFSHFSMDRKRRETVKSYREVSLSAGMRLATIGAALLGLAMIPSRAEASCGDYLHPPGTARNDRPEPCRGPHCQRNDAPILPTPTLAPPLVLEVKAVVRRLADDSPAPGFQRRPREPRASPQSGPGLDILRPPRLS